MINKLGRNYTLNIQTLLGTTITIQPPFTIEFDITRNILSAANLGQIRIYNVAQNIRNQIRKDINDNGKLRIVQLQAGYGINLPTIFDGNISQAWSVREGTNFITQIESFDGGYAFANAVSGTPFPVGTDQKTVISSLMGDLSKYGVQIGAIGNSFQGALGRGNSYQGPTIDVLRELAKGGFFIDNGKAYALGPTEMLSGTVTTVDAGSGLLGTPTRENYIINFDMLFEPRIVAGQQINLVSSTDQNFNGPYKVISVKHHGMISETVCGDAITSLGLYSAHGFTTIGPVGQ